MFGKGLGDITLAQIIVQIYHIWDVFVEHDPLKPFPHTKQQPSAEDFENMVTKEEITPFEQILLLSPCFQKPVGCRGVRKGLYVGMC